MLCQWYPTKLVGRYICDTSDTSDTIYTSDTSNTANSSDESKNSASVTRLSSYFAHNLRWQWLFGGLCLFETK